MDSALDVVPSGPLPLLPRVGIRLALPLACQHVTWFGRGPHENYPDRQRGRRSAATADR